MSPFPINEKLKGKLQRSIDSFKCLCTKLMLQKSPNTRASGSIAFPAVVVFFYFPYLTWLAVSYSNILFLDVASHLTQKKIYLSVLRIRAYFNSVWLAFLLFLH